MAHIESTKRTAVGIPKQTCKGVKMHKKEKSDMKAPSASIKKTFFGFF